MIRIVKPDPAPAILATTGKAKRRGLGAAYSRFAPDYLCNKKKFAFERSTYAHKSVKEALIRAQHGKCAFCESKITHISYGDVEHFRPKAGYCQHTKDRVRRPGYYWLLAYEWANLLLSCQLCNQRHKKHLFPIVDPSSRALSHKDDLSREEPLFIHPAIDDPETYIAFRQEILYPIGGNPRGKATIENLGLNREPLREARLDHYKALRCIHVLAKLDPPIPESHEAQAYLERSLSGAAKFAGMARCARSHRVSNRSKTLTHEQTYLWKTPALRLDIRCE